VKLGILSGLLNSQNLVILDSAMGTELQFRRADLSLPLWSARAIVENPQLVRSIYDENIQAGADIITTNTFRTQRVTFEKAGYNLEEKNFRETAFEFTRLAVNIAKEAVKSSKRKVLIAGGIAPLEDCYKPELVPDTDLLCTDQN
jgi:S-methylmethionine-dependent homocysteine/selenocysteine methylase